MIRSSDLPSILTHPIVPMKRPPVPPAFMKFRQRGGRGIRRAPGEMNRTERKYAERMESLLRDGKIEWYAFEVVTFKIAADVRYTPDFAVLVDGWLELHEVKGSKKNKATGARVAFIEDDAKLKIKLAASLLPFRFSLVWPDGTGWGRKDFWSDIGIADAMAAQWAPLL